MKNIAIVDYGLGNLFSVKQALDFCSNDKQTIKITSSQTDISSSDYLILPGVGAFKNAMHEIQARNLSQDIINFAASGKPLLGICLGMQILASSSKEFGTHRGLDLIPGSVSYIGNKNIDGTDRKVPSIGWKELHLNNTAPLKNNPLYNHQNSLLYFVHSYHFNPTNSDHRLAYYNYGDTKITAAVQKNNIIGCQFHPEKSGKLGLDILHNFLHL